jgi:RNA polymerase sigma-70 factor (ECF subfamily)
MAGIAKFKVIDYKRKYLKEVGYENIDNLNIHIPDNSLEGIIKKELEEEINEMLSCLKEKDRELFYKLYIEEKEIKDVSFETGLKREVIYNRLTRGKKKLQRMLNISESRG